MRALISMGVSPVRETVSSTMTRISTSWTSTGQLRLPPRRRSRRPLRTRSDVHASSGRPRCGAVHPPTSITATTSVRATSASGCSAPRNLHVPFFEARREATAGMAEQASQARLAAALRHCVVAGEGDEALRVQGAAVQGAGGGLTSVRGPRRGPEGRPLALLR